MGNKITRVVVGGSQGDINFESLTNSLFFIQSCFCYSGISSIEKISLAFPQKNTSISDGGHQAGVLA